MPKWWLFLENLIFFFKNHIYIYAAENHKIYYNKAKIIIFDQYLHFLLASAYIYTIPENPCENEFGLIFFEVKRKAPETL